MKEIKCLVHAAEYCRKVAESDPDVVDLDFSWNVGERVNAYTIYDIVPELMVGINVNDDETNNFYLKLSISTEINASDKIRDLRQTIEHLRPCTIEVIENRSDFGDEYVSCDVEYQNLNIEELTEIVSAFILYIKPDAEDLDIVVNVDGMYASGKDDIYGFNLIESKHFDADGEFAWDGNPVISRINDAIMWNPSFRFKITREAHNGMVWDCVINHLSITNIKGTKLHFNGTLNTDVYTFGFGGIDVVYDISDGTLFQSFPWKQLDLQNHEEMKSLLSQALQTSNPPQ